MYVMQNAVREEHANAFEDSEFSASLRLRHIVGKRREFECPLTASLRGPQQVSQTPIIIVIVLGF